MALHLLSIALEFLTKHHISEPSTGGYKKIVTTRIENAWGSCDGVGVEEQEEEEGWKHGEKRSIDLVVASRNQSYLM